MVFPGGDNFVWSVLEVEAPDFVKTVPGKCPAAALLRPFAFGGKKSPRGGTICGDLVSVNRKQVSHGTVSMW